MIDTFKEKYEEIYNNLKCFDCDAAEKDQVYLLEYLGYIQKWNEITSKLLEFSKAQIKKWSDLKIIEVT